MPQNTLTFTKGAEMEDYDSMTVADLRKLTRARGWTGASVLSCSQAELVHFLKTGEKPVKTGELDMDIIGKQIAELFRQLSSGGGVNEDAVRAIVQQEIGGAVKRIEIIENDKPTITVDGQHKQFEKLYRAVKAGVNLMIVGPAGSGKTHALHAVADALGVPFYCMSVGAQTTKSDILGFMDAHGKYVESSLYHAMKGGGVYALDEIDAGNANVLTVINSALANGAYMFPNGERVVSHQDFHFVACGNTYGTGANAQYVGRNQLDAATLDRFTVLTFDYDETLELAISPNTEWTKRVQAYRAAANTMSEIRVLISPRASIMGGKLINAGMKTTEVEQMVLWKGMKKDHVNAIKNKAGL